MSGWASTAQRIRDLPLAGRVHSLLQHQRGRLVAAMLVGFLLGGMFVAMLGLAGGDFGRPDRNGFGNPHSWNGDGDGPPMDHPGQPGFHP